MLFGVLLLSTLSLWEYYRLTGIQKFFRVTGYSANVSLLGLVSIRGFAFSQIHALVWIPLVSLFFFHLFSHVVPDSRPGGQSLRVQSGLVFIGFFWISQTLSFSVLIRPLPKGEWWLFLAVAAAASCDVGAYFVGKLAGRRKLAPTVSPGKTVEGTLGGILLSFLAISLITQVLALPRAGRILLGLALPLAAVMGDLVESYFKRKVGVKDSGTLVAGHGGMLDRLDSHFFTLAVLYLYLTIQHLL